MSDALKLADELDAKWFRWANTPTVEIKAAAELRRLHAELCRVDSVNVQQGLTIADLKSKNAALREAAQAVVDFRNSGADVDHDWGAWDALFYRLRVALEVGK